VTVKKRITAALSVLLLAAVLSAAGCELLEPPFPAETEGESRILIDPAKTMPEPEPPLTPEEEALAELAAEALWREKGYLPAREYFAVEVHPHASNGSNRVEFTLRIGGYWTDESYNVRISAEGEVTDISGGYHSYHQFVEGATPDRIAAAEAVLDERLKEYGGKPGGYYLTVDEEGYLCLSCEVIVYLDGPASGDGGCGIDHEHKFFHQRVCCA
jgi:hypothetical protein